MDKLNKAITLALLTRRPILVYSEPGRGAVYTSMGVLGLEARYINCSVVSPSLPGVRGGLVDLAGSSPVLLDYVDRVQNQYVLDEIRKFLVKRDRPIIVLVHGEPSLELEEKLFQGSEFTRIDWR